MKSSMRHNMDQQPGSQKLDIISGDPSFTKTPSASRIPDSGFRGAKPWFLGASLAGTVLSQAATLHAAPGPILQLPQNTYSQQPRSTYLAEVAIPLNNRDEIEFVRLLAPKARLEIKYGEFFAILASFKNAKEARSHAIKMTESLPWPISLLLYSSSPGEVSQQIYAPGGIMVSQDKLKPNPYQSSIVGSNINKQATSNRQALRDSAPGASSSTDQDISLQTQKQDNFESANEKLNQSNSLRTQEPSTEAAADNQSQGSEDLRVVPDVSVAQASKDNTSSSTDQDISLQTQKQDNFESANEKLNQSNSLRTQEPSTEAAADNQSQGSEDLRVVPDVSVAHAPQQASSQPAPYSKAYSDDFQNTRITHSESNKLIVPPIASESTESVLNGANDMAVQENITIKSSTHTQLITRSDTTPIPVPIKSEISIQPKDSTDKPVEIPSTDPISATGQSVGNNYVTNQSSNPRNVQYLIAQISGPDQLAQLQEIDPISIAINPVVTSSSGQKLVQVGIFLDTRVGRILMSQRLSEIHKVGIVARASRSDLVSHM